MTEEKDGPVHYQVSVTGRQAAAFFLGLLAALGLSFFFGMKTGAAAKKGPDPISALTAQSDIAGAGGRTGDGGARRRRRCRRRRRSASRPRPRRRRADERRREGRAGPPKSGRPAPRAEDRGARAGTDGRADAEDGARSRPGEGAAAAKKGDEALLGPDRRHVQTPRRRTTLAKKLKADGFKPVVSPVTGKKGLSFRVRVGPYPGPREGRGRRDEGAEGGEAPDEADRRPREMSRPLPVRGEPALPPWIRERKVRLSGLHELKKLDAHARPPHGLRGGALPEPDRVLREEDRDVPRLRRRLHARLRLLQRDVRAGRAPSTRRSPANVARAVVEMGLEHVVLTSVDRDDLPDGGAAHWVRVVEAVKALDAAAGRRGPHARLPGGRGGDRPRGRRAPRRLQPQRRDGPAPLPDGEAEGGLRALGRAPGPREGAPPGDGDEVGADARPRRGGRRGPRRLPRPARRRASTS